MAGGGPAYRLLPTAYLAPVIRATNASSPGKSPASRSRGVSVRHDGSSLNTRARSASSLTSAPQTVKALRASFAALRPFG